MKKSITFGAALFLLAAVPAAAQSPVPGASMADTTAQGANPQTEAVHSVEKLRADANAAARRLIETLGRQQAFAMLGWQVNSDYRPANHCFEFWHGRREKPASQNQIDDCEQHAADLSRLYASYQVHAPPIVFKSEHYWRELRHYDDIFPRLVQAWKDSGGTEDNASYLDHPVCAKPLQKGWTGSEFFYDGAESGICRFYKVEAMEGGR